MKGSTGAAGCRRRRRLRSLAASLALSAALTSCGIIIPRDPNATEAPVTTAAPSTSDAQDAQIETNAPETTAQERVPVIIPDYDALAKAALSSVFTKNLDGVGIMIAANEPENFVPTGADGAFRSALLERNRRVEDKLNTTLLTLRDDREAMFENAKRSVQAGTYYADLLAIPQSELGRYQAAGLLLNLRSLPFADFTADYYDHDAMNMTSAGYSVYAAVSDASVNANYMYVLFFNKSLASDLGLDGLYDMVYSGGWSWDWLLESMRNVNNSLDGADLPPELSLFGSVLGGDSLLDSLYTGSGCRLISSELMARPELAYVNDRSAGMADVLKRLLASERTYDLEGRDAASSAVLEFYNGRLLFLYAPLYTVSWLTDMPDNWGILPLPKVDPAQEDYFSSAEGDMPLLATLKSTSNLEGAGLTLQALAAASDGVLYQALCEELTLDYLRDSDSLNMLDRAKNGLSFDFAAMFSEQYDQVYTASYDVLHKAVRTSSTFSELSKRVSRRFDSFVDSHFEMKK